MKPLITVAIAAYNVGAYIGATIASIERQSIELSNVEFIVVNDGSTDDTLKIANDWASSRSNVTVFTQNNRGVGGARQAALELANGIWFTSIDPDDLLDKDYFKHVVGFIKGGSSVNASLLVTNIISLNDTNGRLINNHALRRRFSRGTRVASLLDEPQNIQLGATAFMRLDVIKKSNISYHQDIRPTFEDAHFLGQYLAQFHDPRVAMLSEAKYYYRKRFDASSLVQSSWSSEEKYNTVLERGYLDLLKYVCVAKGVVPEWTQYMVLYDVFWYFLEDIKQFSRTAWIDVEAQRVLLALLKEIFDYISIKVISEFNIYKIPMSVRQSIVIKFKGLEASQVSNQFSETEGLKKSIFLSAEASKRADMSLADNVIRHSFFGETFSRECIFQGIVPINFLDHNGNIVDFPPESYYVDNVVYFISPEPDGKIVFGSSELIHNLIWLFSKLSRATELLYIRKLATGGSLCKVYKFAAIAFLKNILKRYAKFKNQKNLLRIINYNSKDSTSALNESWCIMDRPNKADDNGEHLYRYLMQERPDINPYFILKRESSDWSRLEAEGFRLLEPGSKKLSQVVLKSRYIISSDAVAECMYPVDRALVKRSGSIFVFLQHGVIMNDLSRWLNPKEIGLLITSTVPEFQAISGSSTPYSIPPERVVLTGLARFDSLLELRNQTEVQDRNVILIMPTWRRGLNVALSAAETIEERTRIFNKSEFYRNWQELILSEEFEESLQYKNVQVVFFPHPSLMPFTQLLDFPDFVMIADESSVSLQSYLSKSLILVTDYSSVSFDAAYINIPTIYFQFDRNEIYGGSHNFRPGYFDYEEHGFGPVHEEYKSTLNSITSELEHPWILSSYENRFSQAFPTTDSNNRRRIVRAIESLKSPEARH